MNEHRIATDETPDLSHWDLEDEELDRISPTRACVASFFPVPCKG